MKFQDDDTVKRKFDIENNTGKTFKVTRVYEDREQNEIIDIENVLDPFEEYTCYPEQLIKE